MCGIVGMITFTPTQVVDFNKAVSQLRQRGPDNQAIFQHKKVQLGHTRLAIIDTSTTANQPFTDASGRYTIIFNGEIYNYQVYRKILQARGYTFLTTSDTECLLYGYIHWGIKFLDRINGFFTFAIYDKVEETVIIARDRMGIKPLLIYQDENRFCFASEMKALLALNIPKQLDKVSLFTYFQLTYIPPHASIFEGVHKLPSGSYALINCKEKKVQIRPYYQLNYQEQTIDSYENTQKRLVQLLRKSVQQRLVADVPLGTFLSGGIDSSIITALASEEVKNLHTFSIGYKDEPLFDETAYALLVAKKYKTEHTVFSLTNDDLLANLFDTLNYIDEPFADPSSLAVNILSKYTKQQVTVALSGDGADELFAGYNKHRAAYQARRGGIVNSLLKNTGFIWSTLPKSRYTKAGNLIRQLDRFSTGLRLSNKERYWRWASIRGENTVAKLLKYPIDYQLYNNRKKQQLSFIQEGTKGIKEVLLTDMNMVLQGDMLQKVDSMSMAHGLEVRTPFLDHTLVEFAFQQVPDRYKINGKIKKRILQDAFRAYLPTELYNRPKHGFDVPLLKWFQTSLKDLIVKDLLHEDFIREQDIFNYKSIQNILQQLFSKNPGDTPEIVWSLVVFQYWWKRYMV